MFSSTDVNFIATSAVARAQELRAAEANGTSTTEEGAVGNGDAMAALERQARAPMGFVAASTGPEGGNIKPPQGGAVQEVETKNEDEIDLGEEDL
jgi:pre-mRNA-splicing factor SYF1